MAREVAEETGLDIAGLPRDPHYHALSGASGTVIVRRYFLPLPADAVAASIRAFVAGDPEPEIEEPVIIRSADDLPDGIMPYMATLIAWHFSAGRGRQGVTSRVHCHRKMAMPRAEPIAVVIALDRRARRLTCESVRQRRRPPRQEPHASHWPRRSRRSLMPQRVDRVEAGAAQRREEAEAQADRRREADGQQDHRERSG